MDGLLSFVDTVTRMESVDERLTSLWRRSQNVCRRFVSTFDLDKKFRSVQLYAQKRPILTLIVLVATCCLSVPVGAFFMFAAGSIALTFMGFMFVEGTILTIAGLILGGILLVVCFFVVTFGGVVFLFFVFLNKVWSALDLAAMTMSRARKPQPRPGPQSTSLAPTTLATRPNHLPENLQSREQITAKRSTSSHSSDGTDSDVTMCGAGANSSGDFNTAPEDSPEKRGTTSCTHRRKTGEKDSPESESTDSSCSFDIVDRKDCKAT